MGQRLIHISQEFFKDVLKLPADMEIVGVSQDFFQCRGDLVIKVESPMFSEVKPGNAILYAYPEYSCYRRDCGCYETKLTGWSGEYPTNRESYAAAFGEAIAEKVFGPVEQTRKPPLGVLNDAINDGSMVDNFEAGKSPTDEPVVRRGREFI